jgi:MFS family permease
MIKLPSLTKEDSATPNDRRAARRNLFVAFTILFCTVGIPAMMIPVLLGSIQDDTGWSRGNVSTLNSIKFGVGAATAFFTGHLVERFGVKRLAVFCAVMAGVAMVLFANSTTLPMLYLVGALLGFSALGTTTSMKIFVSQWFVEGQGVAVGIAFIGLSSAGVVVPWLTTVAVDAFGWRNTVLIMSSGIWFVALPILLWGAREHVRPSAEEGAPVAESPADAFRSIRFSSVLILLLCSNFLIGLVDEAVATHLFLFLDREVQLGAAVAAIGFSSVMLMSNVGKIGFGWLIQRFSTSGAAFCFFVAAFGVLLTLPVGGLGTIILLALVYGPTQGGFLVNIPVLSRQIFGPVAMIRVIAVMTTAFNLGAAVGPAGVGYVFDATGSYRIPFILLSGIALVAALLMVLCGRLVRRGALQPGAPRGA